MAVHIDSLIGLLDHLDLQFTRMTFILSYSIVMMSESASCMFPLFLNAINVSFY